MGVTEIKMIICQWTLTSIPYINFLCPNISLERHGPTFCGARKLERLGAGAECDPRVSESFGSLGTPDAVLAVTTLFFLNENCLQQKNNDTTNTQPEKNGITKIIYDE